MFSFVDPTGGRRLNLTPMIDVVFLLLVFFMLASRFSNDMSLPLGSDVGVNSVPGPPRLIDITPTVVKVNGTGFTLQTISKALYSFKENPHDVIIVRPLDKANVQRLVTVLDVLHDEGFTHLVLMQDQ